MQLKRELSDAAAHYQAEQLAEFSRRGGSVSAWLTSKDFLPGDRAAILRAWAALEEQAS
jgi:hypothetical protein